MGSELASRFPLGPCPDRGLVLVGSRNGLKCTETCCDEEPNSSRP